VVTTRRRVIAAIAALTATLLLLTVARANAHPLHTTLTDVAIASGNVRATVRLFADDLAAATKARSDAEITAYVTRSLTIVDGTRTLATRSCGVQRTHELLWVCVEATLASGGEQIALRNAVLSETFKDQINIVQVTRGATKRSVVFTRGDGVKRLLP
jgi:hypothetical protein